MSMPTFDDRHLSIVYSQAPRLIKLGFLNIQSQHIPKLLALSCFIISNFQTLSLLLTNSLLFLQRNSNPVHPVVHSFIQIFAFSDWFSFTNDLPVTIWTVVMSIFLLHFLAIFAYFNFKISKKTLIPDWIQKYWGLMSYIHPLICFYPIHTFNIKAIQNSNEGNFIDSIRTPIKILFYLNLIINFWLAIIPTSFFHVTIKTKDILSSKNNINRTKDILSKIIIPILWIVSDKSDFMPFFILTLTVLDSISRDIAFFYYLPYYHIQTLQISAVLQGIITSLALLTLITRALSYTNLHIEQLFLHVVWIIIASLSAKLYYSYLWRILKGILAREDGEMNMYYALHKKILVRYLMKRRTTPYSDTRIFNWEYFIFEGKLSQISSEEIIKNYTKEACQKNPKSHLAKITLAHYYVKTENSYLLANNLIEEVQQDLPSFPERISLSLIRFELQKRLYQQYSYKENDGTGLNLLQYIQTNNLNDLLKEKIKYQVKKQLEFWNNFLSDKPDMGILTELAIKVGYGKKNVQKTWKELSKIRSSAFHSPPLMYGMYISLVNNDTAQGEKFIEQYHTDLIRTSKLLEVDELNNDTMMAEDTVQISMSGSRKKIGYILDCSSNISEVYGWKKEFLEKQPIITIMSPYYQQKHDRFLMHHYNTGDTKLLNNTSLLPVTSSDGYLKPSRVHIKMHPFVEQGISYISVLRVLKEPRRMLLIRKDGTIDGMSKNFSVDMNLHHSKDNQLMKNLTIFHLCPEFRAINSAFNTKAFKIINAKSQDLTQASFIKGSAFNISHLSDHALLHEDHPSNLNLKLDQTPHNEGSSSFSTEIDLRAQVLYDTYSAGAKLTFYPLKTSGPSKIKLFTNRSHTAQQALIYHVQITTRIHDKDFIKVIFLDRITEQIDGDLTPLASENSTMRGMNRESGQITSNRPLLSPSSPVISKGKAHDLTPDRYIEEEEVNMSKTISIPEELMSHEILDGNPTRRSPKKIMEIIKENKGKLLNQREVSSNNHHDHQEDQIRRTSFEKTRFGKLVGHVLTILNNNNGNNKNKNLTFHKKPQKSEYYLSDSRRKDEPRKPKFHHHEDLNLERNEGSVAGSYFSRGIKVRLLVAQALNTIIYKTPAIIFGIGFFIFISLVLGLQILQSFNVIWAIDDIKSSTALIENGALKLNSLISLAMYSRLWAQVIKGNYTIYGDWPSDNEAVGQMFSMYTRDAYKYNNNIWKQVGQIHEDHQGIFYQENIRIFEVENGEETLLGTYAHFDATSLILGHSTRFLNQNLPMSYQPDIPVDDLQFILYNFYSDFLKSIEDTSLILIDDLQTTLQNTNQYILKTNIAIIISAVLFLGTVLWYLVVIRKASKRFMNILFRLNVREARETKFLLEHFVTSFDTNWQDFDQSNNAAITEKLSPRNDKQNTKKVYQTASMGRLYKTQIFTFLKLFPLYFILLGLSMGYYFITNDILGEIKKQQAQIQSSLWAFYYQNLLITEFIEMVGSNSTTTVRHDPMEEEILEGLVSIKDIGSFVNQFRNRDGNFTEAQYEVLFDFSCENFRKYSSFEEFQNFLVLQCEELSQGTGRTNFPALILCGQNISILISPKFHF